MIARPSTGRQMRQLYALAHAIKKRADKRAVAKVWFARAKALLAKGRE